MSESERKALLSIVEFLEDFASPFDVSDHGWALLAEARDLLSTQPLPASVSNANLITCEPEVSEIFETVTVCQFW